MLLILRASSLLLVFSLVLSVAASIEASSNSSSSSSLLTTTSVPNCPSAGAPTPLSCVVCLSKQHGFPSCGLTRNYWSKFGFWDTESQLCHATSCPSGHKCIDSIGSCTTAAGATLCPDDKDSSPPVADVSCNFCVNSCGVSRLAWCPSSSTCYRSDTECASACPGYTCPDATKDDCADSSPAPSAGPEAFPISTGICPSTDGTCTGTHTSCTSCFTACGGGAYDVINFKCYMGGGTSGLVSSLAGCRTSALPLAPVPYSECPTGFASKPWADCASCSAPIYSGGCGGFWTASTCSGPSATATCDTVPSGQPCQKPAPFHKLSACTACPSTADGATNPTQTSCTLCLGYCQMASTSDSMYFCPSSKLCSAVGSGGDLPSCPGGLALLPEQCESKQYCPTDEGSATATNCATCMKTCGNNNNYPSNSPYVEFCPASGLCFETSATNVPCPGGVVVQNSQCAPGAPLCPTVAGGPSNNMSCSECLGSYCMPWEISGLSYYSCPSSRRCYVKQQGDPRFADVCPGGIAVASVQCAASSTLCPTADGPSTTNCSYCVDPVGGLASSVCNPAPDNGASSSSSFGWSSSSSSSSGSSSGSSPVSWSPYFFCPSTSTCNLRDGASFGGCPGGGGAALVPGQCSSGSGSSNSASSLCPSRNGLTSSLSCGGCRDCGGVFCAGFCYIRNFSADGSPPPNSDKNDSFFFPNCPAGLLNKCYNDYTTSNSQRAASISLVVLVSVFNAAALAAVIFYNWRALPATVALWRQRRVAYKDIADFEQQQRERAEQRRKRAAEKARQKRQAAEAEAKRQRTLMQTCTVRFKNAASGSAWSLWRDPDSAVWSLHFIPDPKADSVPAATFGPQLSQLFANADHVKSVVSSPRGRFLLVAGDVPGASGAGAGAASPSSSQPQRPSAAAASSSRADDDDDEVRQPLLSPLNAENDDDCAAAGAGYGSTTAAATAVPIPSDNAAVAPTAFEHQAWLFDLVDGGTAVTTPTINQRAIRIDPSLETFLTEAEPEVVSLALVALRWLDAHDKQIHGSIIRSDTFFATLKEYEDACTAVGAAVQIEKQRRQQEAETSSRASSGGGGAAAARVLPSHGDLQRSGDDDDGDDAGEIHRLHASSFARHDSSFPAELQQLLRRREEAAERYAAEVDAVEASLKITSSDDQRLALELGELLLALAVCDEFLRDDGQPARSHADSSFSSVFNSSNCSAAAVAQALFTLRHQAAESVAAWMEQHNASSDPPLAGVTPPPMFSGGGNLCVAAPPAFPLRPNTELHKFAASDAVLGRSLAAATTSWDPLGSFPLLPLLDAVVSSEDLLSRAQLALTEMSSVVQFHRERGPLSKFAEAAEMERGANELECSFKQVDEELVQLSVEIASLSVLVKSRGKRDSSISDQLKAARKACALKKRERDAVMLSFSKLFAARPELQLALEAPELDFEFDLLSSYEHRLLAGGQSRHRVFEAKSDADSDKWDLIIKEYGLSEEKHKRRFQREMDLLRKAKHPRIVAITRVFFTEDGSAAYVVMPRYPGTVHHFLEKAQQGQVTTEWLRACVREAIRSVEHLHSLNIMHCDVKPDNFLVDDDAMPILSDFDVSLDAEEMARATATSTSMSAGGTAGFCAPELLKDAKSVSFKCDVFSLGRTFEELIKLIRHYFPQVQISPNLDDLVQQMVRDDPLQRPDLCDAQQHKYFTLDHLERERQMEAERRQREQQMQMVMQQHQADLQAAAQLQQQQVAQAQSQLAHFTRQIAYMTPPPYWSNTDAFSNHFAKIDVTREMKQQVQRLVNFTVDSSTLGHGRDQKIKMKYSRLEVESVYRVENMTLWRKYAEKCQEMVSNRPRRSYDTSNAKTMQLAGNFVHSSGLNRAAGELYLWHGTKPPLVPLIAEQGFDERLASTRGLFSAGNYCAEYLSKSDQYCTPEPSWDHYNGNYFCFLTRVLFGTPFETQQQFTDRIPPLLDSSNPSVGRFDSLLGQVSHYREHVVYDKSQVYPEYIVVFKRR